ncbi:MarR family transcriptional regulator [Microtetraspora fusca]|uniref:MarR family transcriptional regulator n=1 Tax=Microtetraspora fusca TaxID=1997 RepID=A0ABW6VLF7_MICFU
MAAITAMENMPAADVDAMTDAPETVTDAALMSAPDEEPDAARNARDGAVWAALIENPGASATTIGVAAGMSRVAAGKILNRFEADGRATRVLGGHDGRGRTPDRWHPVTTDTTTPAETAPELDSGNPADIAPEAPADLPGGGGLPAPQETALETADLIGPAVGESLSDHDATGDAAPSVAATPDSDAPAGPDQDAPAGDGQPAATDDAPAAVLDNKLSADMSAPEAMNAELADWTGSDDDTAADHGTAPVSEGVTELEITSEATGGLGGNDGQDGADTPAAPDAVTGAADEANDACQMAAEPEDPAWGRARAALLELVDLIIGTVTAADGDGDAVTALGRLEMAMAKAPQAHRDARAILTGTTPGRTGGARASGGGGGAGTGGVRPGQLRDRVLSHLLDHPGKDFTPYEIGRVLDSSSGAVANALDRLTSLGQAELTCERPRRYALAVNPAPR